MTGTFQNLHSRMKNPVELVETRRGASNKNNRTKPYHQI